VSATRALDGPTSRRIAGAFLPERWYGDRMHYFYARAKLRSDPLYPGIVDALRGGDAPVLDLGCGIGLLAHALRADGNPVACRGVDNDAAKIEQARRGAANAGLRDVAFECVDLAKAMPAHRGSVAILDVLQFVAPAAQDAILDAAIAMLVPGARLVIRTGLADGSARARTTRCIDALSRALGWMNAGPQHYPDADALRARFDAAGLRSAFTPLYGRTPFNNWRVIATKPASLQVFGQDAGVAAVAQLP
jgi:SAM-dependent methyltransferase